jgi:hypothetical protein
LATFAGYTLVSNGITQTCGSSGLQGCLGYAFKHIDSDNDRLIDGVELMLGTVSSSQFASVVGM